MFRTHFTSVTKWSRTFKYAITSQVFLVRAQIPPSSFPVPGLPPPPTLYVPPITFMQFTAFKNRTSKNLNCNVSRLSTDSISNIYYIRKRFRYSYSREWKVAHQIPCKCIARPSAFFIILDINLFHTEIYCQETNCRTDSHCM
jgi:hypothetical protein